MKKTVAYTLCLLVFAAGASAHVNGHPSVHDTVASIVHRLSKELPHEQLLKLTAAEAEQLLTADERRVLSSEHITFSISAAATLYIARTAGLGDEPFWLKLDGFERTPLTITVDSKPYELWRKHVDAGPVGLGVHSLSGGGDHYLVILRPDEAGATLTVSDMYPGQNVVGTLTAGTEAYVDRDNRKIGNAPPELEGQVLIRMVNSARDDARLTGVFRVTTWPATDKPDHVVLTWAGDPKTTQAIQWRSDTSVMKGVVKYVEKANYNRFEPAQPTVVDAETRTIEDPELLNDPVVHWHTAEITGLEPDTTYLYSVGDGSAERWTELAEFNTAPASVKPFSFIYMGDAQNGLDRWGSLVHKAFNSRPDAAFYIMAGDLVNRGAERDDWDSLLHNGEGIFGRRQLVPCLGNHEYQSEEPTFYLDFFDLPENGPSTIAPEKAYSYEYSNALFVVLDSNLPAETQTAWLEQQLANTKATWKFVVYHHPAYSSGPRRDNPEVRALWGPLFDKYHVDMALQGHDHAYLRTYPMKNEQKVASPAEGTVYVISVSGTKFYQQAPHDYTEFGMTNIATFQVLDIQIKGDRLVYRAYDVDGNLKDELIIQK